MSSWNIIDGIAMNNLSQQADQDQVSRPRRQVHCSHCGQIGHNIQTCRFPGAAEERQRRAQARQQRTNSIVNVPEPNFKNYMVYNDNVYPITVFWYSIIDPDRVLNELCEIIPFSQRKINSRPELHIISLPTEELKDINHSNIKLDDLSNLFITGDTDLTQLNESTREIIFFKEYNVPKSELEQWKECGLKSLFLLKEIERLGGKKVDTIEPLLDMVQDIVVPIHDEYDKEKAGVPSSFTNIA